MEKTEPSNKLNLCGVQVKTESFLVFQHGSSSMVTAFSFVCLCLGVALGIPCLTMKINLFFAFIHSFVVPAPYPCQVSQDTKKYILSQIWEKNLWCWLVC